jgi:heat shock protein HslJ
MQKIIYPLIAILVLTCSCCKTSKKNVKNEKYPLIGTQWLLESIEGEEIGTDYALRPFIKFDTASNITGNLGCNSLHGTYEVQKKHKMTISYVGSTKRLCQQMSVERNFIKALKSDINKYEIKGDELILYAENEEIMRFKGVNLNEVE